jgi:hypothetical protein
MPIPAAKCAGTTGTHHIAPDPDGQMVCVFCSAFGPRPYADVTCQHCHEVIGRQYKPGDGILAFQLHLREAHPELIVEGLPT